MVRIKKAFAFLMLLLCLSAFISCDYAESIPKDWPDADEMIENLKNKGYTITEDNKVKVEEKEYAGVVIIAKKGSNFAAGFWAEDADAANDVYEYWGEKYNCTYQFVVGTTVYFGSKKGVKHAGINVK